MDLERDPCRWGEQEHLILLRNQKPDIKTWVRCLVVACFLTRLHKIKIPYIWERWAKDWQQLMTVAIEGPPPAAGWRRGPRLNSLSVVIRMQHLAVIYAKAEKLL